jgi:hypothetical protein
LLHHGGVRTKETRVNSRARIEVIGAGWCVTENHIPLLEGRSDIELAAVCRRSPEELRRVKDRFGFTFATTDYREMLETPLDGVIVGSPHDRHHEHARTASGRACTCWSRNPWPSSPRRLESSCSWPGDGGARS